jgi:hypothetical protein
MGSAEALKGSGRATHMRGALIAAIQRGPAGVLPAFLLVVLVASGAAVIILREVPADGPQLPVNDVVRAAAGALAALAGVGYLVLRLRSPDRGGGPPAPGPPDAAKTTGLIALGAILVLLLVPVYLLAAQNHPPTERWLGYGFYDKRWIVATFLLGTLGLMVVLTAASQVVRGALTTPDSWRSWAAASFGPWPSPTPSAIASSLSWARIAALTAAGFALAAYFFAPPWHVALSEVNLHETPMMFGVQGIANGAVPYIGSGAVQYGPGSELIHYGYLQLNGFNLEAFRQSTVLLYWIAATIFFVTIFLRLRPRLALIACLVSVLLFPALQMIGFQPDGSVDNQIKDSMDGIWGWPNAMRYVGIFALAMLFPATATLRSRRSVLAAAIALGVLWGLTCFISQENLPGGAIALGTLAVLLAVTQTVPIRSLARALAGVFLGAVAVAVPVIVFYAANGELSRFFELYYFVPPAVAAGYSDTVYYGGFDGLWGSMYVLLPFLLCILCVLALVRLHPLGIARRWEPERVLLVSALVAACVANIGSLPRADPPHLLNTMLALPVAIVLAVAYLPRLLGFRSRARGWLVAAAVAAAVVALMPFSQVTGAPDRLTSPIAGRFSYESPALAYDRIDPHSVAGRRLTRDIAARPGQWCCTHFRYPTSMREFGAILNRLHAILGDRRVYVANFIDELHPGAAYFLADLNPAPIYFEPLTMAINEHELQAFLAHFRDHLSEVDAVVAVYPKLPEAKMFARRYPNHRTIEVPYTWGTITVLLR